jgi:hypothetical protein
MFMLVAGETTNAVSIRFDTTSADLAITCSSVGDLTIS